MSQAPNYHRDVYLPLATRQEEVCIDTAAQHAIMALRHLPTDVALVAILGIVRDWMANAQVEGDLTGRMRMVHAVARIDSIGVAVEMKQNHVAAMLIVHEAADKGHYHVSETKQ